MPGQTTRKTLNKIYPPVNPNLPAVEAQNLGEGARLGEYGPPRPLLHAGQKRGKNRGYRLVEMPYILLSWNTLIRIDTSITYSVKSSVEAPNY